MDNPDVLCAVSQALQNLEGLALFRRRADEEGVKIICITLSLGLSGTSCIQFQLAFFNFEFLKGCLCNPLFSPALPQNQTSKQPHSLFQILRRKHYPGHLQGLKCKARRKQVDPEFDELSSACQNAPKQSDRVS